MKPVDKCRYWCWKGLAKCCEGCSFAFAFIADVFERLEIGALARTSRYIK